MYFIYSKVGYDSQDEHYIIVSDNYIYYQIRENYQL